MYDTLLQLPLFQGLSQEDFTNIISKVKLHFVKYKEGQIIVNEYEPCEKLIFILNGEIESKSHADNRIYFVKEWIEAPAVLEPHSLFGKNPVYKCEYKTTTPVDAVLIDKSYILNELLKYEIFSLNYLNLISTEAQTNYEKLRKNTEPDLRKRMVDFMQRIVDRPYGKKSIKIKMERMADMVTATRINVSRILNQMEVEGLVELHRAEIVVHKIEKLF